MKRTKKALFSSVVALILCFSMLVGTTFAWFTDEVKSGMNQIVAGNLDVELYHADKATNGASEQVKNDTKLFDDVKYWEPGAVVYENLTVVNAGTLALKWQMGLNFGHENDIDGHKLSDVLQIAILDDPIAEGTSRDTVLKAAAPKATSLAEFFMNGDLAATESEDFAVVIFWLPGENDNIYNLNNGKLTSDGQKSLHIEFGVLLQATQMTGDNDSFGADYDVNAAADFFPGFQGGSGDMSVTLDENGYTTEEVTQDFGDITVVIPVGVKLAAGYRSLKPAVNLKNTTETNLQLSDTEKMRPSDVHIEGVAKDNTTAMFVILRHYLTTGINTGALKLYHVENGEAVAMTHVANPVNHNEFSYDPSTGDVTLALASFSEVAVVADTTNTWNGTAATAFAGGTGTEADPYQIANADQLAYFRNEVDGGRTFDNEFVKLTGNIYLSNQLFDPIGWGYENSSWNRTDADGNRIPGKVFKGTFDGGYYDKEGKLRCYTIYDLRQSGWDLEKNEKGEVIADYTYTNCGFGLFAAAADATFKNLTIYGADIRVECVETGILVGLSQGSCTYENINIHNSKIANYQRPTGGLIGEVSPLKNENNEWYGATNITDVEIGSDVVVGSLWGDFDAPCGGVIGARWDDTNTTTVNMKDVTVGCRMDVYNDITSAYQWHAYRRAGMLIGNTEQIDENNSHLAAARFLSCENVNVYYGEWANYTYCEFNNHNDRYPWVRTQAGENCTAFSNPRWGVPNDVNGKLVKDMNHVHKEGDECGVLRQFAQLYGGGQGVYGQHEHSGVTTTNYKYSITYVNDYEVLDIVYVVDNSKPFAVGSDQAKKLVIEWANKNIGEGKFAFGGWMNAGSTKLTQIDANNTKDIVLYPYFNNPYTARFVDQNGNVVAYCFFHKEDTTKLEATRAAAEAALPDLGEDMEFNGWKVHITDNNGKVTSEEDYVVDNFKGYEKDVTVYPVYLFKGDVNLVPVDTDSDGIIDHYLVAGYTNPNGQALVEIPASVNGKPIIQINQDAFSSYGGVHAIVVPNGVTIQKNAFTSGNSLGKGEEITIYFEGTKDQWNALTKDTGWDYGIGNNSRVFFLKDGKVDTTQGYLQVGSNKWNEKTDFASVKDQYTGYCNCEEKTDGDTAHIYVDEAGNLMGRNDEGTPVNAEGKVIKLVKSITGYYHKLTTADSYWSSKDTYYRYRPDAIYWDGVNV